MGKHEWMTRQSCRSRYTSVEQPPDRASGRARWRTGRAAAAVAASLVAGLVIMLWLGGMFSEPERSATKIATAGSVEQPPGAGDRSGNQTKESTSTSSPGEADTGKAGTGKAAKTPEKSEAGKAPSGLKTTSAQNTGNLVLHVAGAVQKPGIVTLKQGSRVHKAIKAAGGALDEAQLDAINLAATVQDGQQLYVPTQAEASGTSGAGTAAAGSGGAAGSGAGAAEGDEPAPLIDINTADAAALSTLPGVGPVLSQRIVDWRTEHGAYGSIADLDAVSGIGEKMLASLGELVTV